MVSIITKILHHIARLQGYPIEEHSVKTKDGYILGLHRINLPSSQGSSTRKPAVLLQHGLLADSANWISNGPKKSLAFQLADKGNVYMQMNSVEASLLCEFNQMENNLFLVGFY